MTTVAAADGTVSVFLGGGQKLVLGGEATALTALADPYDPAKVQIGISEGGTTRAFPDGFVAGGSVAGLLRVQNHDLADARGLLGQLASAIAGSLNAQQALGLDLGQPPGRGAPLLSVGAASVAPSSNNAQAGGVPVASYVNGAGVRVPSVSIDVVTTERAAAERLRARRRSRRCRPARYRLTRLQRRQGADGRQRRRRRRLPHRHRRARAGAARPLPAAAGVAGARIMQRVLDDPKGIAAASPVTATVAAANTGTAAVASLARGERRRSIRT